MLDALQGKCDEYTFCDLGGAIARFYQDIATFGTEGGRNSFGESLNSLEKLCATLDTKLELLMGKAQLL